MTAIQAPVWPSSTAELGTGRGRLVFWLLTIEGALVFDLFLVSLVSKVFREVSACMIGAPEYFRFS